MIVDPLMSSDWIPVAQHTHAHENPPFFIGLDGFLCGRVSRMGRGDVPNHEDKEPVSSSYCTAVAVTFLACLKKKGTCATALVCTDGNKE